MHVQGVRKYCFSFVLNMQIYDILVTVVAT